MSNTNSAVRTEQQDRVRKSIPIGAIQTVGLAAICERGRIGTPVLTVEEGDWSSEFGDYVANGNGRAFAAAFYAEHPTGRLLTTRIAHFTDVTNASTGTATAGTLMLTTDALSASSGSLIGTNLAPFNLTAGDDLDIDVDGGGAATATFSAAAAALECATAETYALVNNQTLLVAFDGGSVQTVTFTTAQFVDIANATAEEVALSVSGQITGGQVTVTTAGTKVTITSDKEGTGSQVHVSGGTANGALGFSTSPVNGTGNVADINAVTVAEVKTIVEAAVSGCTVNDVSSAVEIVSDTTGASSSILVEAGSTADDELGLDNALHTGNAAGAKDTLKVDAKTPGAWCNTVSTKVEPATSGEADEFKLSLIRGGVTIESFDNLSMTDTAARYVETIINHASKGSKYIAVTDQDAAASSPADLPAQITSAVMAGGDDGLTSLADTDFVGGTGANGDVGLRTFDQVADISLLACPDRATSVVHNGMITYCDITRGGLIFAILDPPAGLNAQGMYDYVNTTALLYEATENAATYWPRVKVANPNKTVFGTADLLVVPPSGSVTGVYARVSASRVGGAFIQPAGKKAAVRPRTILGLEGDELEIHEVENPAKRGLLFQSNVNPICTEGGPVFFDGARNLDISGNWPSVGQRLGVQFVERSVITALGDLRHQNLDADFYAEAYSTVDAFLDRLTLAGAFKSRIPSQAYSVNFGSVLNPPAVQDGREARGRIGMATSKPGEFITIQVGPDQADLEGELAALAA